MRGSLNNGSVLEDPVFCMCGTKRRTNKSGLYFCPNCDSVQLIQNVEGDEARVSTTEDVTFDYRMNELIQDWFEEGWGADPIYDNKGKLETFTELYGEAEH